jgi:protein-tyrosine-phosphatase
MRRSRDKLLPLSVQTASGDRSVKVRRIGAIFGLALALGGCNGDEPGSAGNGDETSGPLTKQEFIARADEICEQTEHRIQALEPPSTTNDLDDYADAIGEISDEGIGELRALKPPPGDAEVIRELIANIEKSVELLPEYAQAAQSQDATRFRQVEARLQEIADESVLLAREYGFKQCGGDEGAPAQ